jgi:hypothetical protein
MISGRTTIVHTALLAAVLLAGGCATTQSLPQSTAEADTLLEHDSRGGYWPRYRTGAVVPHATLEEVYQAAKAALVANHFAITKEDKDHGIVMGQHGATLFYWNVMAGVYLRQESDDVVVRIVTVGSKDVGFIEIKPSDFPQKILATMQTSLRASAPPSPKS